MTANNSLFGLDHVLMHHGLSMAGQAYVAGYGRGGTREHPQLQGLIGVEQLRAESSAPVIGAVLAGVEVVG
jgi:hypothetical protein